MTKPKLPTGVTSKGKKFLVSICYRKNRFSVAIDNLSLANITRAKMKLAMEKAHGDPKLAREMFENEEVYQDVSLQDLHQYAPAPLRKKEWTVGEAHDALLLEWKRNDCHYTNKYKAGIALRHFGSRTSLSKIDTEAINGFMDLHKSQGQANATIRKNVSVLLRMMSLAVENGRLLAVPKVKLPKVKENPIRWIGQHDPQEAEKIENFFVNCGLKDHLDVFVCLMDLGVRQGELFSMREENIKLDYVDSSSGKAFPIVTFWKTKNTHPRTIPMSKRVVEVIKSRLSGKSDRLIFPYNVSWFKKGWDRVRDRLGKADDASFTPHICRHTAASLLVQKGIPLKVVQEWLGHQDIKMTLRYAHLAPTSLIAAVDVINKINGNGNIDTADKIGKLDGRRGKALTPTGKYRKGDKAEANKLINKEVLNIIENNEGRLPV